MGPPAMASLNLDEAVDGREEVTCLTCGVGAPSFWEAPLATAALNVPKP